MLWCTSNQLCIEDLAELWSRLGDRGRGKLLLSGLSVSDSPLLSDRCCRHRSMHHTLVKAPLLHPPPFRWKSTPQSHHTYIYVLTDTLTRRARTCSAHIQTPFPLWWQILPELAPICESWHGVLSESNSPVICPSQMDPRVVRGALSGGRGCTTLRIQTSRDLDREQTHISQALRCERATFQQGGQVNHLGLTGFNPLNHEFTPS